MFKYLTNKEIDKEKWDKCITQSAQSLLYALSFYLDIVAPHWAALVEEDEINYLTVIPLPTQTKYGITFLHQPLFCQQLGIFSIKPEISPDEFDIILNAISKKYAFASHYHFNIKNVENAFRLCGVFSPAKQKALEKEIYEINMNYTHLLPLQNPYKFIYQNYSLDRKKNLKRAQKANLTIVESEDVEPLIQMFDQDISHKIRGGVAANAYDLLRKIYEELKKRKLCRLFYTQNAKGEINAGALFAFHQNQIIYLFNAAFTPARKENGRMLLIDYILKIYANTDKVFDFESPEIASITYFYQSFGAKAVPYAVLRYNHLPAWIKLLWKIKKRLVF